MKIIFFGTPEFALPSLKILHESQYEITAVVSAPDKPRGRGRNLSPTVVKKYAVDNNIRVFTPEKLKSTDFEFELKKLQPDLFVVVAFRILPENIFSIPLMGAFNLHGSLLPKYRGAAPIQWAIINGEKETGLTTFFLKKKVDTGNIILKEKIKINDSDNFGTLHDRMSIAGAELVLKTVRQIESVDFSVQLQDDTSATPAPKISNEICKIDWFQPAEKIHNLIRGLSPYPGAHFIWDKKNYKVFTSRISEQQSLKPLEIIETKNQIFIGTETYDLEILELQPEGRKRLSAQQFLRGYSLLK